MEGYAPDSPQAPEKKGESKTDKKSSKESLLKLGGKTLETGNKKEAAHKIADSSIWEKLIPKAGKDKTETLPDDKRVESAAETKEIAPDVAVERLTSDEQREVVKDRAQERLSELQTEPLEEKSPAEAVADSASREFYEKLAENPDSVPEIVAELPTDTTIEEAIDNEPEAEQEAVVETVPDAPAEFEHDQAIDLNAEKPAEDSSKSKSAGSAANQPPQPPSPPTGSGDPNRPNFNQTASANPNTVPTMIENHYHQEDGGSYLLAGGILGYMLGRRRGRIKTEKKLKAVTKNLERQIQQTHERIDRQERTVREQARERYNKAPGATTTPARREQRPQPTAEQLHASPAEIAAVGVKPEQIPKMDHRELLAAAEKIDVDGTNLRQIFEAKQITEPGLRRLTQEYLRGGDVRKALQYERQVKEMQYERDPQMRDRLAASYAEIDAARPQSAQEALSSLLAQDAAPSPQVVRAAQQAAADEAKADQKPRSQVLLSAWVAFVILLVIIIVVLALR